MSEESFDPRFMEPDPRGAEREIYDRFIKYYTETFDAYRSCIRIGFQPAYAREYASQFLDKPYVQRGLAEHQKTLAVERDDEIQNDKALVLTALRQCSQNGPYGTRVQAAARLAAIRGMEKNEGLDSDQALIDVFREFASRAPV